MTSLEANELVYLYRECQNKMALKIIIDKYFEKFFYVSLARYNKLFFNLPLDKDDIYSITYENLLESINLFNYSNIECNFEQFCYTKIGYSVIFEAKKYLKLTHKCLNTARSYTVSGIDDFFIIYNQNDVERELHEDIENKEILEKFKIFIQNIKGKENRRIMKLKYKGYRSAEIAKKLGLTPLQVTNRCYTIFSKFKNSIV